MPYEQSGDLPTQIKDTLPPHAQDIYKEAFNSAWDEYRDKESRRGDKSREQVAHQVAWAAVKKKYEKVGGSGWQRKSG